MTLTSLKLHDVFMTYQIHDFFYKQPHFLVSTGLLNFSPKFQYWSCLASCLIFDLTNFKTGSIQPQAKRPLTTANDTSNDTSNDTNDIANDCTQTQTTTSGTGNNRKRRQMTVKSITSLPSLITYDKFN